MWLNIAIVGAQVVFGFVAHSLGLIADAGHNLTDVIAVLASLVAVRLARRPATSTRTYGMHRATVLAAQGNAASILIVTALVTYEAIRRLTNPTSVNGSIVVIVALGAAAANALALVALRERSTTDHREHNHGGHNHGDLNMRSVSLHMAADSAASVGVAICGLIMARTHGWYWLDPAVSIAIGVIISVQAWKLLRTTLEVLLEATPDGLDVNALTDAICRVPGVDSVHDVHVWTLASDVRALSAHLVVEGQPSLEAAQRIGTLAKAAVSGPFAIAHATFELESDTCRDDGSWCALDVPYANSDIKTSR